MARRRGTPAAARRRSSSPGDEDPVVSGIRQRHRNDLQNLDLTKHPLRTLQLFGLASLQYLRNLSSYIIRKGVLFMILITVILFFGLTLTFTDVLHDKHTLEFLNYAKFVLWWLALGVASSIGLGSGLHTFVIYLGPHIAFFTIKAVQCGRVDLKTAPYDTIQLDRGPSWLAKDCSKFGPPLYPPSNRLLVRIPVFEILPQVQLEAILWGIGTAIGELPPYFISRAARLSGSKLESVDLGVSSSEDGTISSTLNRVKHFLFSHSRHLNFFTILLLASIPNPLFDLAGIMCGQFGIPFWKFFLATLIGKALVKTHIQTLFIISLCNNQLLYFVEERLIWALSGIPGFSVTLPAVINKLHLLKEKYLSASMTASTSSQVGDNKGWKLSFATIWNTFVWLMLMNFFAKIVTSTAQDYLKKQQELELNLVSSNSSSARNHSTDKS